MDKPKFANLLSRYDYTLEDIDYNVLETNPNSNNEITDDPGTSFCRFRTLHTDDIDQVAHWLGNPDQLYERNILEPQQLNLKVSEATTDTDHIPTLVMAAKHYVYGDSRDIRHLKSNIETHLGPFNVHLLTASVLRIKDGNPLILNGHEPKLIIVDELIFESANAQLISYVNLNLRTNSVQIL